MKRYGLWAIFCIIISVPLCQLACYGASMNVYGAPDTVRTAEIEALHRRAEDYVLKSEFHRALLIYDEIIFIEPDDDVAYTMKGQIYLLLGYYRNAFQAFQEALLIDPDNESAILGIQKIVDPDGVGGLITKAQSEGLSPTPQEAPSRLPAPIRRSLVPHDRTQVDFADETRVLRTSPDNEDDKW